jgi:hypothetical protein
MEEKINIRKSMAMAIIIVALIVGAFLCWAYYSYRWSDIRIGGLVKNKLLMEPTPQPDPITIKKMDKGAIVKVWYSVGPNNTEIYREYVAKMDGTCPSGFDIVTKTDGTLERKALGLDCINV